MSRKEMIRQFIRSQSPAAEIGDDQDIFESGFVSSMFVMQLVLFVEQEFDITVRGPDLNFDSFRSINAVDEFVGRKLATAA